MIIKLSWEKGEDTIYSHLSIGLDDINEKFFCLVHVKLRSEKNCLSNYLTYRL